MIDQLFRRAGSLLGAALLLLAGASTLPAAAETAAAVADATAEASGPMALMRYREGEHYMKVPVSVAASSDDGVEVTEFFSYGCVHCFNFDPMVHQWAATNDGAVAFRRVPAVFNESWAFLAQAFYTAEVLGVAEELHGPLFRAIHTDNINIGDPKLMAALFKQHGNVEEADFAAAFDSFGVRSKVQQASGQGRALRLRAVPSMVVAGQYVVDGSMVEGGNVEMLKVVDYLVELVAAEQGSESSEGSGAE